ncbi:hypothetical protein RE6C_01506 [Rhodopirellula europaea 6C]|uniref:Uncharacterized protein n=1 Tax=Rhodopirellula europaea 6C TaxID=1263867 RepID=M2B6A1_9BACT|nr:hypothetical protein RE6C_01506 [Rhodopirellula europaea 6C]
MKIGKMSEFDAIPDRVGRPIQSLNRLRQAMCSSFCSFGDGWSP